MYAKGNHDFQRSMPYYESGYTVALFQPVLSHIRSNYDPWRYILDGFRWKILQGHNVRGWVDCHSSFYHDTNVLLSLSK